jgi:hypothetical protein
MIPWFVLHMIDMVEGLVVKLVLPRHHWLKKDLNF